MDDYYDRTYLLVEPGETGPHITPMPSCGHGTHRCYTEGFTSREDDPRQALREFARVHWPDHRVRQEATRETVIIETYRPLPDPELAAGWQALVDSVASVQGSVLSNPDEASTCRN